MNIKRCDLCPRFCGVDRRGEKKGFCNSGDKIRISWFGLHLGEEPPISGTKGSGAIFFCGCNLKCVFCQNWQISQPSFAPSTGSGLRKGKRMPQSKNYEPGDLVRIMLELQKKGAHNINLVTPTIWSFWIKQAIVKAKEKGLKIPIVWNSNGYERKEVLKELAGLVDIYLPDYKYDSEKLAIKYSAAPGYPEIAKEAIREMQKQVGDLRINKKGIAGKGLIVRHLILPGAMENTKGCLRFISSISKNIHLSLMSQYNPLYRAKEFGEINRPISQQEFTASQKLIDGFKIKYGWVQEFGGAVKCFNPDFRKENPFR